MDSTAQKQTEPDAAAAPHPFNGRFQAVRVDKNLKEDDEGHFDFDITPGGDFNSGRHTPAGGSAETLDKDTLNRQEIKVRAADGRFWHGKITRLSDSNRKIIIGQYHIPERAADEKAGTPARGQDNGTWVATQP